MRFAHLPKAELHCHGDGIVDPAILRALQQQGHTLPLGLEQLQAAYPVRTFDEFAHWFEVADPMEGPENIQLVLGHHLERLRAQNVTYAEIMLGSSELPRDDARLVEDFRLFREAVNQLESGRVQVELLVAFGRNRSAEYVDRLAERLIALHAEGLLAGVAVAGWPETTLRPFGRALRRMRQAGLGIEVHAGEWAGPESVWEALEIGHAQRLGHGVALFRDPALIRRVREERIHVEMCPTSNLRTGAVADLKDHPIRLARDLGLNYSLNTDDPGPFECSLDSEYALLADHFGFQDSDFQAIYQNSLGARFQPRLR